MAQTVSYNWESWEDVQTESGWDCPGVYALVAKKEGYTTLLGKKSRILYIGEAGSLYERLRISKKYKKANHHLLWYVDTVLEAGTDDSSAKLTSTLKQIDEKYGRGVVYACKFDEDGIRYKGRKTPKPASEMLEELLLINHFFTHGQFPPFNARTPSIKSIAEYWATTVHFKWWEKYWDAWQGEKCWNDLLDKTREMGRKRGETSNA